MRSSKRTRDAAKGKRYSDSEKRAVLDYVEGVNAERGRGGVTAAAREFGVSSLTIAGWIKKERRAGADTGGRLPADVFRRLGELHEKIVKAESELQEMRKQYARLKAML